MNENLLEGKLSIYRTRTYREIFNFGKRGQLNLDDFFTLDDFLEKMLNLYMDSSKTWKNTAKLLLKALYEWPQISSIDVVKRFIDSLSIYGWPDEQKKKLENAFNVVSKNYKASEKVKRTTEHIRKTATKLPKKKMKLESVLSESELEDLSAGDIYFVGIGAAEQFDFKKGLDELIKKDDTGRRISYAGANWKEFDFKKGFDAIIKKDKKGGWIYHAGVEWKKFDYKKGLDALKKLATTWYEHALRNWPRGIETTKEITKEIKKTATKMPKKKLKLESKSFYETSKEAKERAETISREVINVVKKLEEMRTATGYNSEKFHKLMSIVPVIVAERRKLINIADNMDSPIQMGEVIKILRRIDNAAFSIFITLKGLHTIKNFDREDALKALPKSYVKQAKLDSIWPMGIKGVKKETEKIRKTSEKLPQKKMKLESVESDKRRKKLKSVWDDREKVLKELRKMKETGYNSKKFHELMDVIPAMEAEKEELQNDYDKANKTNDEEWLIVLMQQFQDVGNDELGIHQYLRGLYKAKGFDREDALSAIPKKYVKARGLETFWPMGIKGAKKETKKIRRTAEKLPKKKMKLEDALDETFKPQPIEDLDAWLEKNKNRLENILRAGNKNYPNFNKEKAFRFYFSRKRAPYDIGEKIADFMFNWKLSTDFIYNNLPYFHKNNIALLALSIGRDFIHSWRTIGELKEKLKNAFLKYVNSMGQKKATEFIYSSIVDIPLTIKKRIIKHAFPIEYAKTKTQEIKQSATKMPKKKLKLEDALNEMNFNAMSKEAEDVLNAGLFKKKFDFKKGLDELIKKDDTGMRIYDAGNEWKEFDFNKGLEALKNKRSAWYKSALKRWPKDIEGVRRETQEIRQSATKLPKKKLKLEGALDEQRGDPESAILYGRKAIRDLQKMIKTGYNSEKFEEIIDAFIDASEAISGYWYGDPDATEEEKKEEEEVNRENDNALEDILYDAFELLKGAYKMRNFNRKDALEIVNALEQDYDKKWPMTIKDVKKETKEIRKTATKLPKKKMKLESYIEQL